MPIYEYYCPDNNKIYQFFAKTLAQGQTTPRCPDNPKYRMQKIVSPFAVKRKGAEKKSDSMGDEGLAGMAGNNESGLDVGADDARLEAAMGAMEKEFSSVDENDPRAMGRMMRRLADLTGERLDGEAEEVVRKLEEGTDPEKLEEQFGDAQGGGDPDDPMGMGEADSVEAGAKSGLKEARHRYKKRSLPPVRDPKLYDYD